MKRFRKALSLLIAFLIPISSIQDFGLEFRNENEISGTSETDNTFSYSPFEFVPEEGDLTLEELKEAELDRSDVPFEISYELAQSRLHVNRLYSQEPDDYTVMFQNRDGSKTVYVFSENASYFRKAGRKTQKKSKLLRVSLFSTGLIRPCPVLTADAMKRNCFIIISAMQIYSTSTEV